jgi:succinyl-CoA synthetase beta subunit
MKIHEFQAKQLLSEFGIPIPRGRVATTPEEARALAEEIGGKVVIKAQIHAGGRGKGGGIVVVSSPAEAEEAARRMIGINLVTPQTGPEGRRVKQVLVEEALEVGKELYVGVVIDRAQGSPVIMASEAGGVKIEEVAASSPEKIIKVSAEPSTGFLPYQGRKIAYGLGFKGDAAKKISGLISRLYQVFRSTDASLVEINPLVVTLEDDFLALDAKMNFDDDALYRHADVKELFDQDELDPLEVEAQAHGLTYIKLDGNVGCMVNGAGLAMATMDMIKLAGGEPANFLDVGGGASAEQVEKAFRILVSDEKVEVILINIFGGILRCDRVAGGIVEAAKKIEMKLPMIVRLEGTNVEEGRRILKDSGLRFEVAANFREAAQKVAALAKTK